MDRQAELIMKGEAAADSMRINVLRLAHRAGTKGAHLGGCLSVIEILAALYSGFMNVNPGNLNSKSRDRFILSKGNGSLAHYTALEASGLIDELLEQTGAGEAHADQPGQKAGAR